MDNSSQQNNIGSRILSKIDVDYATLPNDRRVRHSGLEKEGAMIKGNKVHTSGRSLSPSPKTKACRSTRTSPVVMGPSSTFQHSARGSDECEETPYTNKASPLRSMTKHKRSSGSTHSNASSPPTTWVGQHPQKMSRTRRANVVSPVSDFDEVLCDGSPLGTATRPAPIESCSITSIDTQTVSKIDNISSPVGLLESGGLAATERRAKGKFKNNGKVEDEDATAVHNATRSTVSSNKNMIPFKEELEDVGVCRQGRSGRGTIHVKGCFSVSEENLEATETRKPLKVEGLDLKRVKGGHPLMKKGSDRKASPCHTQALDCEAEDDREELLAAANAARCAIDGAYSGPFWKEMEPMLTFISSENLAFLKHQIDLVEELEMSMPYGRHIVIASSDYSKPQTTEELSCQVLAPSYSSLLPEQSKTDGVGTEGPIDRFFPGEENYSTGPQKVEADKWFHEMIPMAQRLLSPLIMEDDFD